MEKYCPKLLPVYFNAFPMRQQLLVPVQYIIKSVILLPAMLSLIEYVRHQVLNDK